MNPALMGHLARMDFCNLLKRPSGDNEFLSSATLRKETLNGRRVPLSKKVQQEITLGRC